MPALHGVVAAATTVIWGFALTKLEIVIAVSVPISALASSGSEGRAWSAHVDDTRPPERRRFVRRSGGSVSPPPTTLQQSVKVSMEAAGSAALPASFVEEGLEVDDAGDATEGLRLAQPGSILSISRSIRQMFRSRKIPDPTLNANRWHFSSNVTFTDDGIAELPKTSWIESKFKLLRPTVVEAQIKQDGAAGDIAMTVFATDHGANSLYSLISGYGEDNKLVRVMPDDKQVPFADGVMDAWHTVRINIGEESTSFFVNGLLQHESKDISRTSGTVHFVSGSTGMRVKNVQWRVDCKWSQWIDQECSVTCGEGTMKRVRRKIRERMYGGAECVGQGSMHDECDAGDCQPTAEEQAT